MPLVHTGRGLLDVVTWRTEPGAHAVGVGAKAEPIQSELVVGGGARHGKTTADDDDGGRTKSRRAAMGLDNSAPRRS